MFILLLFIILNVFKCLVRYIKFSTYTSKIILFVIGVPFSVFLRPNEHLKVFECPVAVRTVICEIIKALSYIWKHISRPTETRFNQIICGKTKFFLLTLPMKMKQKECSEMSVYKIQKPGNRPKINKTTNKIQAYIFYVIHNNNETHSIKCCNLKVLGYMFRPHCGHLQANLYR